MKVYVVIGGISVYDPHSVETLRLFDCKSTAEAYVKELEENGYENTDMQLLSVNMESAIAS